MLDDGRLTDGQGRTVDFKNTIIILTSNLGSDILAAQKDGEDIELVRAQVMNAVRQAFRPEFLNRLDETVLFHRLSRKNMTGIVAIQLKRLQALLADRKLELQLDDRAKEWLAEAGYDPVYGARPLKRVIQRELQNPLASLLLEGALQAGRRDPRLRRQGRPHHRRQEAVGGRVAIPDLAGALDMTGAPAVNFPIVPAV